MLELVTADFFIFALIAGISLSAVAGPLGCFIVWRRMSYFGDTLAHSALLGVALGLLTGSNLQLSIIVSSLLLAFLLSILERRPDLATDTLLGILAHSALAIGVVFLALTQNVRVNLEAYLFGSLLTISTGDLLWIVLIAVMVSVALFYFWGSLLSATVHSEIAEIEGLNVKRLNFLLVVMIALTIAVAMKVVGVLLITSLLIIPPATARRLSGNPEQMAVLAALLGMASVLLGLVAAFQFNTPAGPTIVVLATFFFALSYFKKSAAVA